MYEEKTKFAEVAEHRARLIEASKPDEVEYAL